MAKMKNLIWCLVLLFGYQIGNACSCAGSQSWCQLVSNNDLYDSSGIVWFGTVIDSSVIDVNLVMYKFSLHRLYKGEIIKADSRQSTQDTFYKQFENSDSVIWIAGGSDASCRRYFKPGSYMISSQYYKEEGGPFDVGPYGYTIFFCDEDVLRMNDLDSTFSGFIGSPDWEGVGIEQLHFTDLEELNTSNRCLISTSEKKIKEVELDIFPNPVSEYLTVRFKEHKDECKLTVYTLQGSFLIEKKLNAIEAKIPITDLSPGTYLVTLQGDAISKTKKIIVQ